MRYAGSRQHAATDQQEDSLHRPAPGKQTLSQDRSPIGGGSQQESLGDSTEAGPRREDWEADEAFLSAMGITSSDPAEPSTSEPRAVDGPESSAPTLGIGGQPAAAQTAADELEPAGGGGGELWSEGEEQEREEAEALGGESSGGESSGDESSDDAAAVEQPAGGALGARPAGSEPPGEAGGGQLAGFEQLLAAAPMPDGDGASAPPPPAAGTTIDVAPPASTGGGDSQIEATARTAVASAAAPVPHAEKLQRAFGPEHDLTQLRAQIGGGQSQAAELGASHFAFGSSLYFGHQPTEGEAAHEVAHALLQQQGVRPANGHQQDPAAEQHAELIAKRVEADQPVGDLLPRRAGAAVAAVQRQATPGQEFLQSSWQLVNAPGILYDNTGARLRNTPSESSSYVTLPQNTKVQIVKHNPQARWYAVVTSDGHHGYVADWLVWRHLPEGNTNVYLVKKGDSPLTIARDHYGPHFNRWGQDLRFVVNALVYVNNKGPRNGTGGPGLAKPGSVTESWLKATAAEDAYIWLPSANYLNSIYEEVRKNGGGTGSTSFDTFAKAAGKIGAFSALPAYVGGLAHGFLQSLGDTVSSIFGLLKSIFTGEIIEDVKKLWSALSKLSIKDVVDGLGSWAQSWAPRLTSEDHFVRGHAWGYFAGYICAEIAMFALGGAALNAIKASKLATKLGQVIARVAPRITAAVGKVTSGGRASAKALGEAKDAVLKRFGQATSAIGDAATKARFSALIKAATSAGASAADANRLAKVLDAAGITAKNVSGWGSDAFTKLASNAGTIAELESVLPLVKAGRIVGLEDWLKFSAKKTGIDAQRTAAELREARRLAKSYPTDKVNIGGDARAPVLPDGSPAASFDLSVDNAAGAALRSFEMTTIDAAVTSGTDLSSAIRHAVTKVAKRQAMGKPIPGKLESIVQVTIPEMVAAGKTGIIEIARSGDVVLVTKAVPPKRIPKGNIFDDFAKNAPKVQDSQLLDAVTIVDQKSGAVLGRIERQGAVWTRAK
jgi:hypothetical protein